MRNSGNQICFKLFLQDNLRSGVFLRNQQRLICRRSRCCVLHSHRKRNACLNMCVLSCLSDLLSELAWCLFFTAGTRRITLILGSMSSMMNNSRWAFTVVLQFPISTKCFSVLRKCPKWGITTIYRTISSIKIFFFNSATETSILIFPTALQSYRLLKASKSPTRCRSVMSLGVYGKDYQGVRIRPTGFAFDKNSYSKLLHDIRYLTPSKHMVASRDVLFIIDLKMLFFFELF